MESQATDLLVEDTRPEQHRVFHEPWQARAFAITIALSERGLFSLREFQASLVDRVQNFEKSTCLTGTDDYYTLWMQALEDLLARRQLIREDRLAFLERHVVDDSESRKVHQRMSSRDENGCLRIEPITVDWGAQA